MEAGYLEVDKTEYTRDQQSYLYGRDPSILAFGQRPLPTIQQNLISLYEDESEEHPGENDSSTSNSVPDRTAKVYLRLKPFPCKLKLTNEEAEAYRIANATTLVTNLPALDNTSGFPKGRKAVELVCRKFTFTRTFGPETTQAELFEEVVRQRMADFLAGHNCTLMTYGTTNSGKSYTLQGTTTSPGIIPRALEFVFTNVNPRTTPCYKPLHGRSVVCLNAPDRAQELEAKSKLVAFAAIDKHHYQNAYGQMRQLLVEESPIRARNACDAHYSVWVSFAEIYNENIHDLLSTDCQKRRPLLKLATHSPDQAFIKGLRTICVNSASEAYQVFMAGQFNLKVAATALNARSSRSHCIFTMQLLKYHAENDPASVDVSRFTFCDLAGSERLKKTLNVGDRLREAQNINTSLLVLGRCLKAIHEGQSMKRNEHVGPFRESKLTRLFQRALSGKEQIALVVNVNPLPNLYAETQNVMNFSAIAKKIVVEPKKIQRPVANTRFSRIVAQTVESSTDWDPAALSRIVDTPNGTEGSESVPAYPDDYEDLLEENKSLKNEIRALKSSMLNKDLQLRQELTDTYTAMMKKLENDWRNRIEDVETQSEGNLEWRINIVEASCKEKLAEISGRKRRRTDSGSDDDAENIERIELENARLKARVDTLKKSIRHLRDKNATLLTENNSLSFQIGLANDEVKSLKKLLSSAQSDLCKDDETVTYVEGLRKQLSAKQENVKKLKEFLNEAKLEYINISSQVDAMENRLKDREEALAEATERVDDLKFVLDSANACLEEKTREVDILEEKLHRQGHEMLKAERDRLESQTRSEETIQRLKLEISSLKRALSTKSGIVSRSNLADFLIKEDIFSDPESDVTTEASDTVSSDAASTR